MNRNSVKGWFSKSVGDFSSPSLPPPPLFTVPTRVIPSPQPHPFKSCKGNQNKISVPLARTSFEGEARLSYTRCRNKKKHVQPFAFQGARVLNDVLTPLSLPTKTSVFFCCCCFDIMFFLEDSCRIRYGCKIICHT